MSDFDFDEIDRAVNSALNGQTANSASRDAEVNRGLTVPSRDRAEATGRNLESTPRTEPNTGVVAQPSSPLATPATPPTSPAPTAPDTAAPVDAEVKSDVDINSTVNSIVEGVDANSLQGTQSSADTGQGAGADSAETKPGLPTKRSGRFMDVVHPSSDMRTDSMSPRRAPTINPIHSNELDEATPAPKIDEPEGAVETIATVESVEQGEDSSDNSSLSNGGIKPDDVPPPIDLDKPINTELTSQIDSLLSNDTKSTPTSAPQLTPTQPTSPSPQTEAPATKAPAAQESFRSDGLDFEETVDKFKEMQSEPQTSPFLEGVSVDKRPLGSANDLEKEAAEIYRQETMSPEVSTEFSKNTKKPGYAEELTHPDDVTAADVLPEELGNKLVSIESSVNDGKKASETKPKVETPQDNTVIAATPADTAGPTSIAKQYKEKLRTDDKDVSSDIFDTKNYHKPIKDDKKSKGMSPLIIAIIAIVAVLLIAGGVFAAWWAGLFTLPF